MTAISYSDISKISAAGTFIVEARSPDNGTISQADGSPPDVNSFGYQYRQEQKNFRYQLIQKESDTVVWDRWQQADEPSPYDLFLSDQGWVVIHCRDFSAEWLYTISPQGKQTCTLEISSIDTSGNIPENVPGKVYYQSDKIQPSSFGITWTANALKYFTWLDNVPHFVIQTTWGERLILDLDAGNLITPTVSQLNHCKDSECKLINSYLANVSETLANLKQTSPKLSPENNEFWAQWPNLKSWLQMAVRSQAVDAVPCLHQIAQHRIPVDYSTCHALPDDHNIQQHRFRSFLKLALRVLGTLPVEYACYSFFRTDFTDDDDDDGVDIYYDIPDPVENRDQLLTTVSKQDTSEQILQRLGAPDSRRAASIQQGNLYQWEEHWEYYYGTGADVSMLQLSWQPSTSGKVLAAITQFAPMSTEELDHRLSW